MRSPGWMADIETWVVDEYWEPEKCGRLTPPARHAHAVRPEQSKEFGPAAPHEYGFSRLPWAPAGAACRAVVGPRRSRRPRHRLPTAPAPQVRTGRRRQKLPVEPRLACHYE